MVMGKSRGLVPSEHLHELSYLIDTYFLCMVYATFFGAAFEA